MNIAEFMESVRPLSGYTKGQLITKTWAAATDEAYIKFHLLCGDFDRLKESHDAMTAEAEKLRENSALWKRLAQDGAAALASCHEREEISRYEKANHDAN